MPCLCSGFQAWSSPKHTFATSNKLSWSCFCKFSVWSPPPVCSFTVSARCFGNAYFRVFVISYFYCITYPAYLSWRCRRSLIRVWSRTNYLCAYRWLRDQSGNQLFLTVLSFLFNICFVLKLFGNSASKGFGVPATLKPNFKSITYPMNILFNELKIL